MRKLRSGEVVRAGLLSIFGILILQSAAFAASDLALQHAQEMEFNGQYSLAASAYLAIIEGYDFLPGASISNKSKLSSEEKLILGRRAIYCLGKGMKMHMVQSADLSECPEFHMLRAASHIMKQLEPHNLSWKELQAFACSPTSQSRLWLLDQCLLDGEIDAGWKPVLPAKPKQARLKTTPDPLIAQKTNY